ncbi:hypothetical protein SFRURICE_018003 [Spodoptera frugiperda]|nr:hypothetical protein SFRURICE_018003 [Spodoptera frugiperda]
MPTTRRGEALRQQQGDEGNITLTEEEIVAERGHADEAASAGSRSTEPAPHFTQDFISTLIETITRAQVEANRSLVNTLMGSGGDFRASTPVGPPPFSNATGGGTAVAAPPPCSDANFVKCTARFDGTSPDAEVLEAFLDAVEIYKECAAVSDEHALRGLPMLLEGEAAVWWRGVKASVTTWADATARLRATYGVAQPAHLILREIFAREQQEERAESFICRVRALIARLPYNIDQTLQTDICYGLLHRRVVKRVPRDSVRGLDDLLHKARIAEDTYKASKVNFDKVRNNNSTEIPVASTTDRVLTQSSSATTDATSSRCNNRSRPRCSFCKLFGHVSDECRNRERANSKNINTTPREVRCYGCGKQGVRLGGGDLFFFHSVYIVGGGGGSKCDICAKPTSKSEGKTSFNNVDVDFCPYNSDVEDNNLDIDSCVNITNVSTYDNHPMVNVSVMGRSGVAIVDTGATHSIASPLLHRILVGSGIQFNKTKRFVRLADGTQGWRDLLSAEIEVIIVGRRVKCQFLVLPGSNIRTLLGVDFLTRAGMVLDVARRTWSFSDSPEHCYDFVRSYTLDLDDSPDAGLLHTAAYDSLALRPDEGCKLTPEQRRTLNEFIEGRAPQFARDGHSPAYLTFGRELRTPTDSAIDMRAVIDNDNFVPSITPYLKKIATTLDEARDVHEKAQAVQKENADQKRRPPPNYKVGDLVLLKTQGPNDAGRGQSAKFIPRRDGPYKIGKIISSTTYGLESLQTGRDVGKYHVSHLTPFAGQVELPVREKRKRGRPRSNRNESAFDALIGWFIRAGQSKRRTRTRFVFVQRKVNSY